jgi:hypothetical protein
MAKVLLFSELRNNLPEKSLINLQSIWKRPVKNAACPSSHTIKMEKPRFIVWFILTDYDRVYQRRVDRPDPGLGDG